MGSSALSGRAAAIARRKELLKSGGAQQPSPTAMKAPRSRKDSSLGVKSEGVERVSRPTDMRKRKVAVVAPVASAMTAREIARQRRLGHMAGHSAAQKAAPATPKPVRQRRKPEQPLVEPRSKQGTTMTKREGGLKATKKAIHKPKIKVEQAGRIRSKAYRFALMKGKVGETAFKSNVSGQGGVKARLADPNASSREIAKSIRVEKCSRGKVCGLNGSRPTRPPRKKNAPEKVVETSTLRGQSVTGIPVGRGENKLTGVEAGVCRVVTGTEYLPAEEFVHHCDSTPEPSPSKVTQSQTMRGQVISSSGKVGASERMTGNEPGFCAPVTGTEYLGTEDLQDVCGGSPVNGQPPRVTQTQTARGQIVSAASSSVGLSDKVTGTEPGACASVTGTEYLPAEQVQTYCGTGTSSKRHERASLGGAALSNPKRANPAMGVKQTSSMAQRRTKERVTYPKKVEVSRTPYGNVTTGTQVGRVSKVTGVEPGQCKQVTGTGYVGVEELETRCGIPPVPPSQKVVESKTFHNQRVTGDRAGVGLGITGAEAGVCKAVTGTPYAGLEQVEVCPVEERQILTQRLAKEEIPPVVSGVQPTVLGITGAEKGACKTVTGTYYHGSDQLSALCAEPHQALPGEMDYPIPMEVQSAVAQLRATVAPSEVEPTSKITGDSWDRSSKVTGTSGPWAASRNETLRGAMRKPPMGARQFNSDSIEDVPPSPITGYSGNTESGAKVTLSGGARA